MKIAIYSVLLAACLGQQSFARCQISGAISDAQFMSVEQSVIDSKGDPNKIEIDMLVIDDALKNRKIKSISSRPACRTELEKYKEKLVLLGKTQYKPKKNAMACNSLDDINLYLTAKCGAQTTTNAHCILPARVDYRKICNK